MPAGWQMWMLEQYGINHEVVKAQDFAGDLNAKYDVILLPSGTTQGAHRQRPRSEDATIRPSGRGRSASARTAGRSCARSSRTAARCWRSAARSRPRASCSTCRSSARCREGAPRFGGRAAAPRRRPVSADAALRDAFTSPARLMQTLRDRVADPQSLFYCPGSLLNNEFDPTTRWRGACPRRGRCSSTTTRRIACVRASASRRRSCRAIRAKNVLAERLAARRGIPEGPGEHPVVQDRQGLRRHLRQPDRLPRAAARDVQVDLQRHFHGPSTPVRRRRWAAERCDTMSSSSEHPFGHGRLATSRFPRWM